ncbi:ATP-NAD kinase-like domain-containing protein [Immersiella caudata]|uniref:ATP-NAD kinase-like domain-containing protein n=1 Tax=Immersiella caudata TaxID=314043 RepID=A0AA39X5H7_9PEZI|nr:ATP-NAD kinase-like domain-containing protein [Immersiella caudata]
MAIHMPVNVARIPDATPPREVQIVDYRDGQLLWATQNGDNTEHVNRLKSEEIVFILKRPESDGYLVYSLTEASDDKESDDAKPRFQVSVLFAAQLPEEPLAEFLLDVIPAHLRSDGRNQLLDVIVSTRSGTGQAPAFYEGVLHPLLEALGLREQRLGLAEQADQFGDGEAAGGGTDGYSYRYRLTVTKSSTTVRDFARGLAGTGSAEVNGNARNGAKPASPNRAIVLLSGDGGVIDLLNGIDQSVSGKDTPVPTVAVLPLGTGNALFHSLHKPLYTAQGASHLILGLRTLFRGIPSPLPTFRASFSPGSRLVSSAELATDSNTNGPSVKTNGNTEANGANSHTNGNSPHPEIDHLLGTIVASYGFHASLVWESDTPAYRAHGSKRFGMAAAELLKLSHAYSAKVEVRHRNSSTFIPLRKNKKFNYVLATMMSNLEKTFTISPESKPLDGKLRLVHFGDVGGERTMEVMMAAYKEGSHVRMRWGEDGEGVGYEEVEEVKVTIEEKDERWRKVCVDGTIVEVGKGGWMKVEKEEGERLKILVGRRVL